MTKSEVVEYSCSEEEKDESDISPAEPIKQVENVPVTAAATEVPEKTTKKKKISPPPKKQGSILNFFSKK